MIKQQRAILLYFLIFDNSPLTFDSNVSIQKMQHEGAWSWVLYFPHDTPECYIFYTHKLDRALGGMLGEILSRTYTAAIFYDKNYSKR